MMRINILYYKGHCISNNKLIWTQDSLFTTSYASLINSDYGDQSLNTFNEVHLFFCSFCILQLSYIDYSNFVVEKHNSHSKLLVFL